MMEANEQLLVRLSTQVERLILDVAEARKDIKDVKDDIAKRVKNLEDEKVSHVDFIEAKSDADAQHNRIHERIDENRRIIDFLVSKYWWAVGVGAAITTIFSLATTYIFKHIP
jgi:type I site-specific restriction endonuclease